ncbi:ROK family protein [Siculibacillus lacustris]|uniref:ROK family protein n=1 Tax=Siculibacillus lacustris TaxID=1549641 RepID=UPI001D18BDEB|nr:ROK family protein [Siculibacillus lacustris]
MASTTNSATASGPGHGANSVFVRQFNERVILAALRRMERASKAELARVASLTNNATGVIVQALERAGLVQQLGKKRDGGRGQPATVLALDPDGAYAIGIRLDRGSLETVLVDFAGKPLARRTHTLDLPPPERTLEIVVRDVAQIAAMLAPDKLDRLVGIGVAAPYDLGAWLDKLSLPADFGRWNGFDVAGALSAATGLDVVMENDGTAATVAELFYGQGRHLDDFLYLFLGSAIGGGVVVGGQYLRGPRGNAGDVGMMPVPASRLASAPKVERSWDILLSRASINALIRHLRFRGIPVQGLGDVAAAAASAPAALEEWLADCTEALVGPVLAAAAVLDLPVVVLDGDLDPSLLGPLAERLALRLAAEVPEARTAPRILLGTFGEDAGAVGAASLPFHLNFSPHAAILTGRHADVWDDRSRSDGDRRDDTRGDPT